MVHTCIKPTCGKQYEDNDIDAYYCPDCKELNKKIAEKINATIGQQKERPLSDLQLYDLQAKKMTSPDGRVITFAKA